MKSPLSKQQLLNIETAYASFAMAWSTIEYERCPVQEAFVPEPWFSIFAAIVCSPVTSEGELAYFVHGGAVVHRMDPADPRGPRCVSTEFRKMAVMYELPTSLHGAPTCFPTAPAAIAPGIPSPAARSASDRPPDTRATR